MGDPNRFGHYNPRFLDWLADYIIPPGRDDPRFNQLTVLVYETYIGPMARALYHTHEILFAGDEAYRAFEQRYQIVKQRVIVERGTHGGIGGMSKELTPFATIMVDYKRRIENQEELPGLYFENRFYGLSDYLKNEKDDDWYMANTAGGFWVRRSIDGTEAQIFRLLTKLLRTFEPAVLN